MKSIEIATFFNCIFDMHIISDNKIYKKKIKIQHHIVTNVVGGGTTKQNIMPKMY